MHMPHLVRRPHPHIYADTRSVRVLLLLCTLGALALRLWESPWPQAAPPTDSPLDSQPSPPPLTPW